jgi:hypothetical protein
MKILLASVCLVLAASIVGAEQAPNARPLRRGARVYMNEMPDDFDATLKAAFTSKKVPLTIVASREQADFEIKGSSETQRAGAAKKVMMLNWHSDEQASISVSSLTSGEIVFAYTAHKKSSAHGKQSTAEACAKHLKEVLDKGK